MAPSPSNGTTSTAPCTGTLVPRPIRQSGSSPSPPIGSKNPYSYRYLGKNWFWLSGVYAGIISLFIDPFILNYSKTPFNPTQSNTHVKRCVGNLLKLSYLQVVSPPSIAEQCKEIANQVEIRADTIRMLSKPLDLILPYTSHHPLARFRPPSSSSLRIAFDRAKSEMFP